MRAHRDEFADYDVTKDTIDFQLSNPLSVAHARKLGEGRVAPSAARRR